jgi:membrane-anchored protein YejM (alkaline phosphatase superfamily)
MSLIITTCIILITLIYIKSFYIKKIFKNFIEDILLTEEIALLLIVTDLLKTPYLTNICLYTIIAYLIIDSIFFYEYKVHPNLSFLKLLKTPKIYISSAKQINFIKIIKHFSFLPLFIFALHFASKLNQNSPSFILVAILFILTISISYFKKTDYYNSNVIIFKQMQLIKQLFKKKGEASTQDLPNIFEKSTIFSEDYPLFRHTDKYLGNKIIDINLKDQRPNIIFVVLESFRTKNVGALNAQIDATPYFNELSKQGILFKNFYSNSTLTHNAVISSLFGIPSGFEAKFYNSYNYPLYGLPQTLSNSGYECSIIHNGDLDFDNRNLFFKNNNFTHIIDQGDISKTCKDPYRYSWGVHDEHLMQYFPTWLSKQEKPNFSFLLTVSNHHPWTTPSSFKPLSFPKTHPTYANFLQSLNYTDHCLKLLINNLEKLNLLSNSILFIYGDHGMTMGERNDEYTNFNYLYEENIKTPLLILAKDKIKQELTINNPCSQVDLLPTVLDMLNISSSNHSIGRSLIRENKTFVFFSNPFGKRTIGSRVDNFKYIHNEDTKVDELYDLEKDPLEKNNIFLNEANLANTLKTKTLSCYNFLHNLHKNKSFCKTVNKNLFKEFSEEDTDKKVQKTIKNNPKISIVKLNNNLKITDKALLYISKLKTSLYSLSLDNCTTITDEGLEYIAKNCPNLEKLSLKNCYLITDTSIDLIFNKCKIKTLNIEGLTDIKGTFSTKAKYLTFLNILFCDQFTYDNFYTITQNSKKTLNSLSFSINNLPNQIFTKTIKNLSKLTVLLVRQTNNLSENTLNNFLKSLSNIQYLILFDCTNLTNKSLESINAKYLDTLYLDNANQLTDEGFSFLKKSQIKALKLSNISNISEDLLFHLRNKKLLLSLINCKDINLKKINSEIAMNKELSQVIFKYY